MAGRHCNWSPMHPPITSSDPKLRSSPWRLSRKSEVSEFTYASKTNTMTGHSTWRATWSWMAISGRIGLWPCMKGKKSVSLALASRGSWHYINSEGCWVAYRRRSRLCAVQILPWQQKVFYWVTSKHLNTQARSQIGSWKSQCKSPYRLSVSEPIFLSFG